MGAPSYRELAAEKPNARCDRVSGPRPRRGQHIGTLAIHGTHDDVEHYEADLADTLDQLMRRVTTGHATKAEQALVARATTAPIPAARHPQHDTDDPTTGESAQHGEDDSIDDLDDAPDGDFSPAPATGFGLYDAHEEADRW
ncbi:hypothetical protein [Streptomyces sp. NPDC050416]|uniref:hypothetical protein n=1 Tax=Streptomyces sp. NPDC050416 TaxID=3365611 RepID=UPI00379BCAF0